MHRGRQPAVDRASGHARGWTREALTRPVFKLTGYQLLSCARGMGLDLGELLSENTKPDPAELLRRVREATHGKRQDTLAKLPTIKTKSKIETQSGKTKAAAEGGAETAETKSEATKIVLKTPPSAILRLQSAARQVACNRLDPAQAQQHSAPTTEEAFACLLHAPLNHRRQVLRVEPRWRSLAGVKSAALAIDKLRLRAPKDAITLAQILAVEISTKITGPDAGEAFCRAAGALGSAHRHAASLECAAFCLETVLVIGCWAPPGVRADLLQRTSVVLFGHNEVEAALTVSDMAMAICASQRDRIGMGRVFVDQGAYLLAPDPAAATDSYRTALALLPDSEGSNRAAAYQGLASIDEQAKRFDRAEGYLLQALALIPQDAIYPRAMAQWSAGAIAKASGKPDNAEPLLVLAIEGLIVTDPFSAALATLDFVDLLLTSGQTRAATERAKEMARFLQPFRHDAIAAAAVTHFTSLVRKGELTTEIIKAARKAVEGERTYGIRPPLRH